MNIIFLDVDGVLCTRRSHLAYGKEGGIWNAWDPLACAALLRAIQGKLRPKIVVSSTWRFYPDDFWGNCEEYGLTDPVGEREFFHDDWRTKDLRHGPDICRGHEIQEWLSRHPEVESYVIIDDDSDLLDEQRERHIHTDPENGMQSDHIKRLLNWSGAWKS